MADVVLYEVVDHVATITLNRPEARNALSVEVRRLLPQLAQQADDDADVDVVILTGADPAFCAGLDLKELGSGAASVSESVEGERERRGPFPPLSKPVIGAVNGVAVTGGFELALACDFLVASERARFADTHGRVGIQPGWGLTVLLPQAIGVRRARELSLTGNYLDVETALAWGLVNHVVDHDDLLPFCRKLAADIVSNDQAAIRRLKRTYDDGSLVTPGEAWAVEAESASDWIREGHGAPEQIEARRAEIEARGRKQARP
ncbi:MAG: enoyl-CoA hydratase [Acidimicrobiales bacterium]